MTQDSQEIIYSDTLKYEGLLDKHENKLQRVQRQVDLLKATALELTTEQFRDLLNHGHMLRDEAAKLAKAESITLSKIPNKQEQIERETLKELEKVINVIKAEFNSILVLGSMNPCQIEAYEIKDGIITLSSKWQEELKESLTVFSTPERIEALRLADNLKIAIQELNAYVKTNKAFYAGFGVSGSGNRTICNINDAWELCVNLEDLKYL